MVVLSTWQSWILIGQIDLKISTPKPLNSLCLDTACIRQNRTTKRHILLSGWVDSGLSQVIQKAIEEIERPSQSHPMMHNIDDAFN